jgi:micrococcal nuclease
MLRMSALWVIAAALVITACNEGSSDGAPRQTRVPQPQPTEARTRTAPSATPEERSCGDGTALPAVFCTETRGMEHATVVKIIDGDTLDVDIAGNTQRVRIFGIDTPERGEPCFAEASSLLTSLAEHDVYLRTDVRTVDRYGRLLRYVYQPGGLSIDAVMIADGAAHAWTSDGALRDELVTLEQQTRAQHTGCLWQ